MSRRHAAHEPDVGVGVDEDLDVDLRAQPLVDEHEDALDDDDGGGLDAAGLAAARVLAIVVLGHVDGAARAQRHEVRREELVLDGVGVVVVDVLALGARQRRPIAVVGVRFDEHGARPAPTPR